MPTFNEECERIGHELNTIRAILRTELKKTLVGRWLAKLFLGDQSNLLLHEMPLSSKLIALYRCWRNGGHKPFYSGRVFLGLSSFGERHYLLSYVCEHCHKDMSKEEYE